MSETRRPPSRWKILACLVLLASPPGVAHAQVEAGQVTDDSLRAPLVNLHVSLLQEIDNDWKRIDTTRTDRNGMFQFVLSHPGVYRVGFGSRLVPLFYSAVDTLAADSVHERRFPLPIMRTRDSVSYFEFQVDVPAAASPGSPAPVYPPELRARHVGGGVAAQFVITPDGKADMTTFRVLQMTDPAFVRAVRQVLPKTKFYPGAIGGIRVRQTVQQAFVFNIND